LTDLRTMPCVTVIGGTNEMLLGKRKLDGKDVR
jgi:hypothetical protein